MLGWLLAPLVAVIAYTISDTLVKTPSEDYGVVPTAIWIGVLSALILALYLPFAGPEAINAATVVYAVIIAVCFGAGAVMIFTALKTEQVSNVLALVELAYVVVVLYGGLALHEDVTAWQWSAIVLVLFGTLLVSTTEKFKFDRTFGLVIIGQLLWGVWYIPFDYATAASGGFVMPLFLASVMSSLFFIAYYLLSRRSAPSATGRAVTARMIAIVIIVGATYGIGLLFFGYLITVNIVAIGAAIIASEPAFIILLGRLFYKDRFAAHQVLGFALIISGAVALSILA